MFHEKNLKAASGILRAIAPPLRLRIMEYIDKNERINVNKIYNALKLEQSITSQHLRILRNAGQVTAERDGKFIQYTLNYDKIDSVNEIVKEFVARQSQLYPLK